MASQVDGIALAAVAAGGLFLYSGITGKGVLAGVQAAVQGQAPSTVAQTNPIVQSADAGAPGAVSGPTPSGSSPAAAQDALSYVGKMRYVWGGAPSSGGVDCSSFANMVIGRDLKRAIPLYKAGSYDGSNHGPPTTVWLAWPGAVTVGHNASQAIAGDICVWQTHMGIAIGGGKMVSARSPSSNPNIGIDSIAGDVPGEVLFVRRLKG
jgi:cell wall-associated NlpC family hydrolase